MPQDGARAHRQRGNGAGARTLCRRRRAEHTTAKSSRARRAGAPLQASEGRGRPRQLPHPRPVQHRRRAFAGPESARSMLECFRRRSCAPGPKGGATQKRGLMHRRQDSEAGCSVARYNSLMHCCTLQKLASIIPPATGRPPVSIAWYGHAAPKVTVGATHLQTTQRAACSGFACISAKRQLMLLGAFLGAWQDF